MRREKLEYLVTTGMMEGKLRENMLDWLTKWLNVGQETDALKVKKDKRCIITYAKEQGTWLIEILESVWNPYVWPLSFWSLLVFFIFSKIKLKFW